jgi:tRNA-modifying protein YgfZ
MFRFQCAGPPPAPGTRVLVGQQHAGDVVDAAGSELLAVITLAQADAELELESNRGARLEKLPLPYAL